MNGRKYFGMDTPHFTDVTEHISWIVKYGDKEIACSSESVAEQNVDYYRRQGYPNVSVEKQVACLRSGEVYY